MTDHSFTCILFDLDGTLVDTAPDLTEALNHVLERNGLASVTVQQVKNLVGLGARISIQRSFASYGVEIADEALDEAHGQFLAHYSANIYKYSVLFPGVETVLKHFKDQGFKLGVCTNKTQHLSEELLEKIGIASYFETICGPNTVPNHKPHPDHIFAAIERTGGIAEKSVMIGDSQADVDSAKAAGIPVIAMTYGYTATPAHELGANLVLDDFSDIPEALNRL
ncbi:phosphoglycolate phosphatase [uncultured Cohaesibacter sp.]|uniref:phosphoglycolate phosphatase n=1 Tax=uncultured Cohaesibacter sp. TaxID=1002546 RepID=UPI00292FB8F3|nr:phosphoglycolate phosphatase [uncultured Cohaesibacter sp.]